MTEDNQSDPEASSLPKPTRRQVIGTLAGTALFASMAAGQTGGGAGGTVLGIGGGAMADAAQEFRIKYYKDTLANRPAAGVKGRVYEVWDPPNGPEHGAVYHDTGAAWELVDRKVGALSAESAVIDDGSAVTAEFDHDEWRFKNDSWAKSPRVGPHVDGKGWTFGEAVDGPFLMSLLNSEDTAPYEIGRYRFEGTRDTGGGEPYAQFRGYAQDNTEGALDGRIDAEVKVDGSDEVAHRWRGDDDRAMLGLHGNHHTRRGQSSTLYKRWNGPTDGTLWQEQIQPGDHNNANRYDFREGAGTTVYYIDPGGPFTHNRGPVVEQRTDDPTSPADGRVWYRTDTDEYRGVENGSVVVFTTSAPS